MTELSSGRYKDKELCFSPASMNKSRLNINFDTSFKD